MPIEFRCTGCTKLLRTPDESAGKKARCPDCGTIVDVPAAGSSASPSAVPGGFTPSGPAQPSSPWSPPADSSPFGGATPGGSTPGGSPSGGSASGGFPPGNPSPGPSSPFDSNPSSPFGGNAFSDGPNAGGGYGAGGFGGGSAGGGYGAPPMGNNPYAAPHMAPAAVMGAVSRGPLNHQTVTLDQLLRTTWEIFKHQWGMGLVFALVLFGVNAGASLITTPINFAAQATNEVGIVIAGQFISQIIAMCVQAWVQVGAILVTLHWARTGTVDIGVFFQAMPFFKRALGILFLTNLIIFGVILVCATPTIVILAVQGGEEAAVIGGLAGAVVAIPVVSWLAMRLWLANFFLVDRDTGVIEAMRMSDKFMVGNKLNIFLSLMILGFGGAVVGLCTCFIGFLALPSFMMLFSSVAYLLITGQPVRLPVPLPYRG